MLTFKLSQHCQSCSTCSWSEPVAASSYCCQLNHLFAILFTHVVPEHGSKISQELTVALSQPLIFCSQKDSKPSIIFWNCLWEVLSDDQQGLKPGLRLELYNLTY